MQPCRTARGCQRRAVPGVFGFTVRTPRRTARRIAMRLSPRTAGILLLGLTAVLIAAPGFAGDRRFEHRHPRRD